MTLVPFKRVTTLASLIAVFAFTVISCGENRVADAHRQAMEAAAADTIPTPEEQRAIDANGLKNQGMDQIIDGNYARGAEYLQQAIDLTPTDHNLWYQRGLALIEAGRNQEAYNDLTKAIQLNPRHGNTYKARGTASSNLGRYDEAIMDLNLALEISPRDARAYVERGMAKINKGQVKSGCDDIGRAEWLKTVNVDEIQRRYCGA
jgi:tetratricopeptide (TPR) repeat protein